MFSEFYKNYIFYNPKFKKLVPFGRKQTYQRIEKTDLSLRCHIEVARTYYLTNTKTKNYDN